MGSQGVAGMDQRSVFFDEWLRSLREQYKHVVRSNDKVTLPTLNAVMHNVGFSEAELNQLRLEATMHIDDAPEDFVPDLDIALDQATAQAHPAECICPQCMIVDDGAHDAEGQPLAPEPADEGRPVFLAVDAESSDQAGADEPVTYEDGLALEAEALEGSADDEPADDADPSDETEPEPDAPQQQSLF